MNAISFDCGACTAKVKGVLAIVEMGGFAPFTQQISGTYRVTSTGSNVVTQGWDGSSNYTVGQIVLRLRDLTGVNAGGTPYPNFVFSLISSGVDLYICISNVTGSADPASDGAHWSSTTIPSRSASPGMGSFDVPVKYGLWTDLTSWVFHNPNGAAGFPYFGAPISAYSPASGSTTNVWRIPQYGGGAAAHTAFATEPTFTNGSPTTFQLGLVYPNVPPELIVPSIGANTIPNRALHNVTYSPTTQSFEWRYYSSLNSSGSAAILLATVIQTITLSEPHTQPEAVAEAQAMLDSVSLDSVAYGTFVSLSKNAAGATVTSVGGHPSPVIATGSNYIFTRPRSQRRKGRLLALGNYCAKEFARGNPIANLCVTGEGTCEGVTVNPPAFDGDKTLTPGCTCPP